MSSSSLISQLVRSHLRSVSGYRPGSQPPPGSPVLKLNTNENPYPPSPRVLEALHHLDAEHLRRYPDASAQIFREAAGHLHQVDPDWVIVGNGSDHLLSLIMAAFVDAGDRLVYPWPTYALYPTLADLQGAQKQAVPFPKTFDLPVQALLQARGKVTLVAAPASPSGTAIALADLEQLAQRVSGLLVIDEAYGDFAPSSALALVRASERVVLLRTLSKGYSLAGLRLGYAIAQPPVIQALNQVKDSYSLDAIATLLGTAAIQDQDHLGRNVEKVRRSRQWLAQQLQRLGCQVWPSVTNFLLVRPPVDAEQLMLDLKARDIYVRYFALPDLEDKLRITVGTDAQNALLCGVLADLIS
ncbi:histidinol-phosphate transaminase [Lyngbya confervoides]|uniref:Histidinol-phosphate aminotransferase n=1 Tax=Lyngbya confervoides BDU141951 TaxID=1574623 RepID=A0ABD4T4H5_9CYAN|nr:histidinol-phosphate transaminase [Lyngbya confervoides]MCM1983336.1 histidinol-phosphate transaminase [Lyngbya confervoides BDU141951]